jgi:small-conductance mechanosensitive channel
MIFPYLPGSNSPAFQGISVFLGLMLSLGSSSAITNIIAGIVLTYMRPFKLGDRIKIGDITGDVIEKSMLNTRLLTPKQEEITVPNSTVLSNSVINFSAQKEKEGVIVHTSITIGYDTPWKEIHSAMIEAAKRTQGIESSPEPYVLQRALNDFYVEYQVNGYTKVAKRMEQLYSDLHQHIQDVFNERGMEIMSPHYQAHRDGSHTTIPKHYLPTDYTPEGIRINNKNS